MTVTATHHPLAGRRLVVEGRRAVCGEACLVVRLPDESTPACGLLSVDGVRRLRSLLAAVASGDDGSGT